MKIKWKILLHKLCVCVCVCLFFVCDVLLWLTNKVNYKKKTPR